jgi:EAL domain-containing protein (putative c-di-GMP-specific phosphodiesterase class I)
VRSGGSIGIALSKESFRSSDELLHFGDIAMYHSKKAGKGRVTLFHRAMLEESDKQDQLKSELELAVERGEFLLHYQPSIHLATGRIVGVEALLRWRRANGEVLYPDTFLPLAEKSDLIQKIGEWVLRTACAQNSEWQRAGLVPIRMSVNLSARQLQQRDLPELVHRILQETRLGPEWLELEMTEASLMRNADGTAALLRALGDSGIRTAIDNFGTGSASLSNLRQLKCHTLKMDRGFVSEITTDPRVAALARGLITMAHHLGLSVVAEGVEQKDQVQFLHDERCDNVQGYLIGRPVPGHEFGMLLRSASMPLASHLPAPEPDPDALKAMHAAVGRSPALQWAATRNARDSR